MIEEHGKNIREPCVQCGNFFESESILTQHIIEKHTKTENLVEKLVTIYMYMTPANPKILEVVMKGTSLIPFIVQYQCDTCRRKSYLKDDIIKHQKTDHGFTAHYQLPTTSQNQESVNNSICEDIQIVSVYHLPESS